MIWSTRETKKLKKPYSDLEKRGIIEALKARKFKKCLQCGGGNHSLNDVKHLICDLSDNLDYYASLPVVVVGCEDCGYLSFYSLPYLEDEYKKPDTVESTGGDV